ncbi:hypothetical protein SteCoe_25873 [Stentor coeruleus]|uniref:Uncharacterized protein n=1 Tax=Stentor coeruleus TaxID=5963 RepID=A0A1R2BE56_9CILI|nr:hypothetical protein SteCoe_25873 [Stentor coeruleus]
MDNAASFSNQWKHRENKLFSQKAEVHINEMKKVTSVPKIDPLSRKVAELVTRRELEMLGIPITESINKKDLTTPRSPRIAKPGTKLPSADFGSKDLSPIDSPTKNPQKPHHRSQVSSELIIDTSKPEPHKKIILSELLNQNPGPQGLSIINPTGQTDIVINQDFIEKPQENQLKQEDVINNAEHMKAFREELHKDYPELGLDNSAVGSSFHTNELNELEEACKQMTPENIEKTPKSKNDEGKFEMPIVREVTQEITETDEKKMDLLQDQKKNNMDKPSNQLEHGNFEGNDKVLDKKTPMLNLDLSPQVEDKPQGLTHGKKISEVKDTGTVSCKSKTDRSLLHTGSKFQSTYSLHEGPSKDFANMQNSYYKASFLHSPQEPVPCTVPRCHINLSTCKSSPLYQNIRVGKESKVKCDNGIALVDSLRRLFLKPPETVVPESQPKDFYEKNLAWIDKKNKKTEVIRDCLTEREVQDCTFDPFIAKHPERKALKSMDLRSVHSKSKSSFDIRDLEVSKTHSRAPTEVNSRILENIILYSALSPADTKVGYYEGCAVDRLLEKSKPMVNYKSINFLK